MATIKKGTYRFNDVLTDIGSIISPFDVPVIDIHFNIEISTAIGMVAFECGGLWVEEILNDTSTKWKMKTSVVSTTPDISEYGYPNGAYTINNGGDWIFPQTFTVIEDADVDDAHASWFTANTKPLTTIEYNGAVIASLKAGQSATLECKDKPMLADVVVSVPEGMGAGEVVEEWDGSYTVSGGTISFTIDGVSYEAEEGMTWAEWVDSAYNTIGATVENNQISYEGNIATSAGEFVSSSWVIIDGEAYKTMGGGSN